MCEKAIFTELKGNFVLLELKENHRTISARCFRNLSIFKKNELGDGNGQRGQDGECALCFHSTPL